MMTISSACPKCVTIKKSGKSSCCGRGGSWFRSCGSAGNAKLHHTWYEGIRACKTGSQLKTATGQQSSADQQLSSHHGFSKANSNAVIRDAKTFAFPSANNSTDTIISTPARTSTSNTSTTTTMLMTAAAYPSTLTTTTTTTTTTTAITSMTTITRTAQVESTITVNWSSQGMSCTQCI